MKALLFGAYGQLGMAIVDAADVGGLTLECAPRTPKVTDHAGVTVLIKAPRPEWVINCAEMTNVDSAHENPQLAMAVNAMGPANIARGVRSVGARMIRSTREAVFDEERIELYSEADICRPVSVLGVSIHSGELLLRVMNHLFSAPSNCTRGTLG